MRDKQGFTLMELLVAMAMAGIVMGSVFSVYYSQQKSYVVQEEVSGMQQNLRAALYLMAKEIRMAGCDPTGTAGAGITTAGASSISFTLDLRGKDPDDPPDGDTGDANENITYTLYDFGSDGDMDLGRDTGSGNSPVAENIDAINFVYLDGSGNPTASLSQIRSVQITIVARTGRNIRGYTDNNTYTNLQGATIFGPAGDNVRRVRLATNVKCRNLGL
ncbi:MAG: prepilin-type N-terminal cleavage/methylation domain-containing protein [Deltaproteobacteria bacterium]|nr:prepilin-type N-terminal cleavage/methylation domain-containing protein [Deltaproteobacteria bacterium]